MIFQRPIVVCDGVLTMCTICNQAHVPEESISLDGLVSALKAGLDSQTLSKFQPCTKKASCKTTQTTQRILHKSFLRGATRSGGDTDSEENSATGFSPPKRKSSPSSPFNSCMPTSILIPLRTEPLRNFEEEDLDDVFVDEKIIGLQERLVDQINWMRTQDRDCVALETLCSIKEIVAMVQVFLKCKSPAALEFKANNDSTLTVSYQILHDFKNDFMMLKVHEKYCMFMSPF